MRFYQNHHITLIALFIALCAVRYATAFTSTTSCSRSRRDLFLNHRTLHHGSSNDRYTLHKQRQRHHRQISITEKKSFRSTTSALLTTITTTSTSDVGNNNKNNKVLISSTIGIIAAAVTTTSSGLITSVPSWIWNNILKYGFMRYISKWKTFSLIPLIAAFVGWFTNYLAVKMIFYPVKWVGIPIKKIEGEPLGLIGWQGITAAKTVKMTEAMVDVTINRLLSMDDVIRRLDPNKVADILLPQVPYMIKPILDDLILLSPSTAVLSTDVAKGTDTPKTNNSALSYISTVVDKVLDNAANEKEGSNTIQQWLGRDFLINLTLDIQNNVQRILNLRSCVLSTMLADRSLLGKLFQKTGKDELKFLVDSGLWFGFILGIIQMIIALYWDNPWTLSIGGLIVGLATNWLALKWIFQPINPTKFGPFGPFQGKFLRRQKEVAKDFSNFFTRTILTSSNLWDSIVNDPTTSPTFKSIFASNVVNTISKKTRGIIKINHQDVKLMSSVSKATTNLPQNLRDTEIFHPYVDETLDIETTLRDGLEKMSSEEFEQVLHPVFEEDEITLILCGAFLGFIAGLIQQGIASGSIIIPAILSLHNLPSKIFTSVSCIGIWALPKLKRWMRLRKSKIGGRAAMADKMRRRRQKKMRFQL